MLSRLFRRPNPNQALMPLYQAVIAQGRQPHWYLDGAVPDTLDGRFDMIAAILSAVLIRLEREKLAQESVWLTELFIDDMDGQLRQIGIGDLVVGKHLGRMMSALGGRLTVYREGLNDPATLGELLVRNLYRGEAPAPEALAHVQAALLSFKAGLDAVPAGDILKGRVA